MHRRTKATNISLETKIIVTTRDGGRCLFCGDIGKPEAHVVSRAHGGLGIPENIITVCRKCHDEMDNGKDGRRYRKMAIDYLTAQYPGWTKEKVTYRKRGPCAARTVRKERHRAT